MRSPSDHDSDERQALLFLTNKSETPRPDSARGASRPAGGKVLDDRSRDGIAARLRAGAAIHRMRLRHVRWLPVLLKCDV